MALIDALLISLFWLIFWVVWIVSAFSAKRNIRVSSNWIVIRLFIFVVVVILVRLNAFSGYHFDFGINAVTHPTIAAIGVALCAIGIAFAFWARFYLGRNWGMPMSVKYDPELVTTGPYAYVRNPIYTGVLLAILGTTMAISLLWGIILVVAGAYFIYSATREEKLMAETFPDTYPAYKARTKMLIPFIF